MIVDRHIVFMFLAKHFVFHFQESTCVLMNTIDTYSCIHRFCHLFPAPDNSSRVCKFMFLAKHFVFHFQESACVLMNTIDTYSCINQFCHFFLPSDRSSRVRAFIALRTRFSASFIAIFLGITPEYRCSSKMISVLFFIFDSMRQYASSALIFLYSAYEPMTPPAFARKSGITMTPRL